MDSISRHIPFGFPGYTTVAYFVTTQGLYEHLRSNLREAINQEHTITIHKSNNNNSVVCRQENKWTELPFEAAELVRSADWSVSSRPAVTCQPDVSRSGSDPARFRGPEGHQPDSGCVPTARWPATTPPTGGHMVQLLIEDLQRIVLCALCVSVCACARQGLRMRELARSGFTKLKQFL